MALVWPIPFDAKTNYGDMYVIAGQSNAGGRATNVQTFTATNTASGYMFGNDYIWYRLTDATDSPVNQVDTVSLDINAKGSVWPLVFSSYVSNLNRNVSIVPCALGGTSITQWLPSNDHTDRSTLYGSMIHRTRTALASGTATLKYLLWWHGETDAQNGMSQATYYSYLATLSYAVFNDLGIRMIVCKLQNCVGADVTTINNAIQQAYDSGLVEIGPDLSDIVTDDSFHLTTDIKIADAATRWWNAIDLIV